MFRRADGFALIDILFVCAIVSILCTIALPRMLMARQTASAASAMAALRTINSAQLSYALSCGGGFYAPDLTTLGTAPPGSRESFISPSLSVADRFTRSGYLIQLQGTGFPGAPPSCNGKAQGETARGFKAAADPVEQGNMRFFASNADNQIYEHTATMFASIPEVGQSPIGRFLSQ